MLAVSVDDSFSPSHNEGWSVLVYRDQSAPSIELGGGGGGGGLGNARLKLLIVFG